MYEMHEWPFYGKVTGPLLHVVCVGWGGGCRGGGLRGGLGAPCKQSLPRTPSMLC